MEKYWTETQVYHCKGGNQQLAHKLAAEIGAERILLNMPASAVTIGADRVEVVCADGRSFTADDAILTVPPSVWDNIVFDPKLPELLRPQMGRNVKYLISLKNRFWLADNLSAESLSNGNVQATWELTAGQEGDGPAGMLAYSGGPGADAMRAIPAAERDAAYRDELAKRYPNYAEAFVASRFMDWPAVPWTQGELFLRRSRRGHDHGADPPPGTRGPAAFRRRTHLLQIRRLYGRRAPFGHRHRPAPGRSRRRRYRSGG